MDSSNLFLYNSKASPSKVNLTVPVTKTENICVRYEDRRVFGTSGSRCGYQTVTRRIPMHPSNGGTVVIRRGSRSGTTVVTRGPIRPQYRVVYDQVPRSCYYNESTCAQYEAQTNFYDQMYTLNFDNFVILYIRKD